MEEYENTQDSSENPMPCIDVEQYKAVANAYTANGKYRTKRNRKKHILVKKIFLSIFCGIIFGISTGFGIYIIFGLSGFNLRLLEINQKYEKLEDFENQINKLSQINSFSTGEKTSESVTTVVTDVTAVVEKAMPCVVSVTSQVISKDWYGEAVEDEASGSGIIIGETDDELLIVTNYHVIEDSNELAVQFIDDEQAAAYVKGTDAENDLAVISVFRDELMDNTQEKIEIATLGDSDNIRVGEPAIAIGNALGYGQSVTTGVISAINRQVTVGDNDSYFIQTDAAINPGNSGGALLNMNGEVIGINSNKIANYVIEGMGYAIPITTAKPIIQKLMIQETKKKLPESERAFLGISGTDVSQEAISRYNMPAGVYIAQVVEDTGASYAGIQSGDILVSFDSNAITQMTQLQELLKYYAAGTTVDVAVMRQSDGGYRRIEISVTLGHQQ